MSKPRDRKRAPGADTKASEAAAGLLKDRPCALEAVEGFIRDNTSFESSGALTAAMEAIGGCATLSEVHTTALKHKLFTMESALLFAAFLRALPSKPAEEELPIPKAAHLDMNDAHDTWARVYDIGVKKAIFDVIDPPADEEE